MICVSDHEVVAADTPLKLIVLSFCDAPKPAPVIVTEEPTPPRVGEMVLTASASIALN